MLYLGNQAVNVTTRSRNLIPFPYAISIFNIGANVNVFYNGIITINGTVSSPSTASNVIKNLSTFYNLEVGKTYTLSGCPVGGDYGVSYCLYVAITKKDGTSTFKYDEGSGATFTVPENIERVRIWLYLRKGYVANNLVFKPMLNEGSTALPFEPYIQRHDLRVMQNLVDVDAMLNSYLVKNDDGSYTFTKLGNTGRFSNYCYINLPQGEYVVSAEFGSTNITITSSFLILQFVGYDGDSNILKKVFAGTDVGKDLVSYKFSLEKSTTRVRLILQYGLPDGATVTFKNLRLYRLA